VPSYPERRIHDGYGGRLYLTERRGDVLVHRSWLRVRPNEGFVDKALYELTASTLALPRVVKRLGQNDVLVCVVPTVLAATYATLLPRRPRVVLWVQDLIAAAARSLELGPAARRALAPIAALERFAARRADSVIVCSPGFRDHFVASGVDPARIEVLYNWADLECIVSEPQRSQNGALRVLYAGNVGYTQGFDTLVAAAAIAGAAVEVDIVGAGNAAGDVTRATQDVPNVRMRPPVPAQDFAKLLAAHDVHLVLQRRVGAGANLPSKIATYLASGRPVVASIDPATPAAQLLRESGGALLVEPESPRELAQAMLELRERPELRRELGANGRAFAEARLGKEVALNRFEEIVCERPVGILSRPSRAESATNV
jgi:colanic acid biosynthesis glycosyl transferase WcaI